MIDSWHPDDNQCALFLEGALDEAATAEVTRHLATCNDCLAIVGGSATLLRERAWWQEPAVWAAAAAAVVLLIIGPGLFRQWRSSSDLSKMIATAPRDARPAEMRLSGFPYGKWSVLRGSSEEETENEGQLRFHAAAGEALEHSQNSSSASGAHTAGVAYLALKENDHAIAELLKATQRAPNDARTWNDLAAAQAAKGDYQSALDSAIRAMKLDQHLLEARFNYAFALQRLHRRAEAIKAWQAYLSLDPSSAWADDARDQLQLLTE